MPPPDPHPLRCICGGTYRYSEAVITSLPEALALRPTDPAIMRTWLPLTAKLYRCRDAPEPGSGNLRSGGCGRGADLITDRTGWPLVPSTDLGRALFG